MTEAPDFILHPTFGAPLQRLVMPIIAKVYDRLVPVGTGFVIQAGGLMLTAKHALDYAREQAVPRRTETGEFAPYVDLYALYAANETHPPNHIGGFWPIDRMWLHKRLDIAVCRLKPARHQGKRVTWGNLAISPGLPTEGAEVWAYGYFGMSGVGGLGDDGKETIRYRQAAAFTRGVVVKVHSDYRDRAMLNFPCFRTDARFDPGMSGGPVFNKNGVVCGVVCSSSPPAGGDDKHLSYASLIWPALGIEIEKYPKTGDPRRLWDYAKDGYIHTDDTFSLVHMLADGKGGHVIAIQE